MPTNAELHTPGEEEARWTDTSELRDIAAQASGEKAEGSSEALLKGDEFIESQVSATQVIVDHLIHLPEKAPAPYNNTKQRVINGVLKTAGVLFGAFAIKYGFADDPSLAVESILAGTSLGYLGSSVIQGMLADAQTRDFIDVSHDSSGGS